MPPRDLNDEPDNLSFVDKKTNNKVVYNHRIFREIIVGYIINFAGKNKKEAEQLFDNCYFLRAPESYWDVVYLAHEIEHHWAMIAAFGASYWLPENGAHKVLKLSENNDFGEALIKDNGLPGAYYEFVNSN